MNAQSRPPVIATSRCFSHHLDAAKANIVNGLRLAQALKDAEVESEFQLILDTFEDASRALNELIDDANDIGEYDACGAIADYIYETRRDARDSGEMVA